MKKMKSLTLILLIAISLAFPLITPTANASPGRDIQVYVIKASDSSSSWIGSVDEVQEGVTAAVRDAREKTSVKLAGENIPDPQLVTSTADLYNRVAVNPPEHAVFINTHGEVVPIPDAYAQNDANSGGDAGDALGSATNVSYDHTYTGFLADPDTEDWYQFHIHQAWVYFLSVSMTPPSDSDFDLQLYDPDGTPRAGSYAGVGATDSITYKLDKIGNWQIVIYICSGLGDYTFRLELSTEAVRGGCPFVSVWNGSQYVLDNNVLPSSGANNGTDVEDCYRLEQNLALKDGKYALLVSEFEQEQSFFDRVKLLAVDHESKVNIAVTPDNEILTYKSPVAPTSAFDNNGTNRLNEIRLMDGNVSDPATFFFGVAGDYLVLDFGQVNSDNAKLILRDDMKCQYETICCIEVQVLDNNGEWVTVEVLVPRACWTTQAVNLQRYIVRGQELAVRLFWTLPHRLDYVGLDTSPQAKINVQETELVSAIHSKTTEDAKTKLKWVDREYAKLLPGQHIELQFASLADPKGKIDFFLVSKGHYNNLTCSPVASPTGPDPPVPRWPYWFDLIAKNCREKGWIWANVAGYPFCYVSNVNKFGLVPIPVGSAGLNRYMGRQVSINMWDGHWARRGYHFSGADARMAFDTSAGAYDDLPDTIKANRPIATTDLLWDLVGYVDNSTAPPYMPIVTASITMNGKNPGIFIHSGLTSDADDWMKGYIATALAIEEARAYLMSPWPLTQTVGNVHGAVFSITMLPGGWGEGIQFFPGLGMHQYRYVELMLTVSNHYKNSTLWQPGWDLPIDYSLSVTDFRFSGTDSEVWAEIKLEKSGWETGTQDRSLNDKIGWWTIGLAASTLSLITGVPYLGSAVGLIPMLMSGPSTPEIHLFDKAQIGAYANGTYIDPNGDEWGTTTMYFKVMFIGSPRVYALSLAMEAWLQQKFLQLSTVTRACGIRFSTQLEFTVVR